VARGESSSPALRPPLTRRRAQRRRPLRLPAEISSPRRRRLVRVDVTHLEQQRPLPRGQHLDRVERYLRAPLSSMERTETLDLDDVEITAVDELTPSLFVAPPEPGERSTTLSTSRPRHKLPFTAADIVLFAVSALAVGSVVVALGILLGLG